MNPDTEPLFMSLFVATLPSHWTKVYVQAIFHHYEIGEIARIDFFDDDHPKGLLGAFIHLRAWHFSNYADRMYRKLAGGGFLKVYVPGQHNYIVVKRMLAEKIPDTHLNIHQLVARIIDLENKVAQFRLEQSRKVATKHEKEDGEISETDSTVGVIWEPGHAEYDTFVEECRKRAMYDEVVTVCDDSSSSSGDDEPFSPAAKKQSSPLPVLDRLRNTAELCGNH
jgi:hypothetical protein